MCEFDQLYYEDDGYVIRCRNCGNFHVGFTSVMLTLNEHDFNVFCKLVRTEVLALAGSVYEKPKFIVIRTPSANIRMLLSVKETSRLNDILTEADNEKKALALIDLFRP